MKKATEIIKEVEEQERKEEEQEIDGFADVALSLQQKIIDQFPAKLVKKLKRIAYEIAIVGLSEKEACLIADYDYEAYLELKSKYKIVQQMMELKDLQYKRKLLKAISEKAGNDDKMAMWLLESKYPDEFNRKKGTGKDEDESENMITAALEFVRKTGDKNGIVREESGRAFLVNNKGQKKTLDINELLS